MKSFVYAEGLSRKKVFWKSSCKALTSWKRLVVLDLGGVSKQEKIFMNFSKVRLSFIIIELAM